MAGVWEKGEFDGEGTLKIGFVVGQLGFGGAERIVVDLAGGLSALGHAVVIYCLGREGPLDTAVARTAKLVRISPSSDLRLVSRLIKALRVEPTDIVHAHLPLPGIAARVATRLAGGPLLIYTEHNLASAYRWAMRAMNSVTLSLPKHVIAVAERIKVDLVARGLDEGRVTTIHNGVNVQAIRAQSGEGPGLRARLGIGARVKVIGTVANLHARKGLGTLIESFARFPSKRNDMVLAIVGRDDGEGGRLRTLATRFGILPQVHFLGQSAHAYALMSEFDVFVLPSYVEGLPVALLEAMALARPVVVSAVGGIPEVITDGQNGRLISPGNPQALARVLEDLLEAPDARAALGEAAAQTVERSFSLDTMVTKHVALYEQVLGRRNYIPTMPQSSTWTIGPYC